MSQKRATIRVLSTARGKRKQTWAQSRPRAPPPWAIVTTAMTMITTTTTTTTIFVLSLDQDDEALSTPGRHPVTFSVLGMDCPSCSPRVVRALTSMPSVAECHIDVFAGCATVTYHPDYVLTGEMPKQVTAEPGFKCQVVEDSLAGESEEPKWRMKIQLARSTGEKYQEVDGVKVGREESGWVEVEYGPELNPRDILALFNPLFRVEYYLAHCRAYACHSRCPAQIPRYRRPRSCLASRP